MYNSWQHAFLVLPSVNSFRKTNAAQSMRLILHHGMDGKSLVLYSMLSFNDHPVVSIEKAMSTFKLLRAQRGHINAEFSEVLQCLANPDPTFAGMTNEASKIQGIWLMVSVHLLARLIYPFFFMFLAVEFFRRS